MSNSIFFKLLKLQSIESLSLQPFKVKKKKITLSMLFIIAAILIAGFFLYIFFICKAVIDAGYVEILPNLILCFLTVCIFIFTFFKSSSFLFSSKDTDFLLSLPIKTSAIITSRISTLYFLNVFISVGFLLPMVTSLIIYNHIDSFTYLAMAIVSALLAPVVPMIFSTIFSIIISLLSSKFKLKSTINIILNLFFIIFPFRFIAIDVKYNIIELSRIVAPLANFIPFPLDGANICVFFLSCLLSLSMFFGFVYIISLNYKRLLNIFNSIKVSSKPTVSKLKTTSDMVALYKRELRRYFSSPSYVLNTSLFAVGLILFSFSTLFLSPAQLELFLDIPNFSVWISKFSPLVVSFFVVFTCTTAASFSLEGQNIWLLKILPIGASKVYISKILVNLSVTIPSLIIANTIFMFKLRLDFVDGLFLFVTPTIFTIFSSILGLLFNLRFPNYDWKREIVVIKQSAAVILTLICNAISIGALIGIILLINFINWHVIMAVYSVVLVLITIHLYKCVQTVGF